MSPKLLLTSVGAIAFTAPALAADLAPPPPPPPVYTWTGPYAGGQIGYVWGANNGNFAFATPFVGFVGTPPDLPVAGLGIFGTSAFNGDAQGVIGGAHIGYNYQVNQWVIGIEGAVDGTTLSRSIVSGFSFPSDVSGLSTATVNGTLESGIQGSIRGHLGYAWDRLLIYGTGGVAFASFTSYLQLNGAFPTFVGFNDDGSYNFAGNGFFAGSSPRSSTRTGWTIGGGVQYAINPHWSVMAEYRYSDFGHIQDAAFSPNAGVSLTDNRHLAQNQVQVGFSYKFEAFGPPPIVTKY